jgi:hypothetical protein
MIGRASVVFILIVVSLVCWDCSSSKQNTPTEPFEIDYYTAGGIAGMSEGLHLSSDGMVKFWRGRTLDSRAITDSTTLSDDQLIRIAALVRQDYFYSIRLNDSGDLTTVLNIRQGNRSNMIRYIGAGIPADTPTSFKDLLAELRQIHKPSH